MSHGCETLLVRLLLFYQPNRRGSNFSNEFVCRKSLYLGIAGVGGRDGFICTGSLAKIIFSRQRRQGFQGSLKDCKIEAPHRCRWQPVSSNSAGLGTNIYNIRSDSANTNYRNGKIHTTPPAPRTMENFDHPRRWRGER